MYLLDIGKAATRASRTRWRRSAFFPQNVMVADTSGHIYYQRTGRVPRRPDGYDWSKPVDGWTSATEWQGFHPASDHLQVLDPPQGWMQNCNIPPDAMMPGSPFQPGITKDYLFGSREYGELSGWTNQRGARAVELLAADDSVTAEEAMAYINDLVPYGVRALDRGAARAPTRSGEGALGIARLPRRARGARGLGPQARRRLARRAGLRLLAQAAARGPGRGEDGRARKPAIDDCTRW